MHERLQQRLVDLKREYELGQSKLRELESQTLSVRATLLRISGAIQVLQEELGEGEDSKDPRPLA